MKKINVTGVPRSAQALHTSIAAGELIHAVSSSQGRLLAMRKPATCRVAHHLAIELRRARILGVEDHHRMEPIGKAARRIEDVAVVVAVDVARAGRGRRAPRPARPSARSARSAVTVYAGRSGIGRSGGERPRRIGLPVVRDQMRVRVEDRSHRARLHFLASVCASPAAALAHRPSVKGGSESLLHAPGTIRAAPPAGRDWSAGPSSRKMVFWQ